MKKRKIQRHIKYCKDMLKYKSWTTKGNKPKPYYFKKQIEVAEKLLKGMS